jgi:glycosyltransferase involved in cell wall biosynthesis
VSVARKPRAAVRRAGVLGRRAAGLASTELDLLRSRRGASDLALFHEFAPPPTGGGHQFLRALLGELSRRGLAVELNTLSGGTPACLFNSFNFDFRRLRRFARRGARMVHRVDGPVGVYRGHDDGTDRRLVELNAALADATVLQSRYSLEKHLELGYELRSPVVIPNAPDPSVFHPPAARPSLDSRRLRVLASSWSDNPRKGFDALEWLDRHLDPDRYEVTFAGRTAVSFTRIRNVGALPTDTLAELLRTQDVYLAASLDDPCSNALLEALATGLPALYRQSGGHPELVGEGGIGFDEVEELPAALDRLAAELETRRAAIRVPSLSDVADRYLEVLRS